MEELGQFLTAKHVADFMAPTLRLFPCIALLGEEVYDDYWMFYLTRDMAEAVGVKRPYMNLKTYLEYKQRGIDTLKAHESEIANLIEDESENEEEAS